MIRGFYNSVSGLITLQNEEETITNNITNVNNNGYKKRLLTKQSFDEVMISNRQKLSGDKYVRNNIGTMNLGVKTSDVETIFTQGSFKSTDKQTDFAIDGRGFFVARNANGQQVYTRDGNFKVNQQGYLITNDGCEVMGNNNTTGATEDNYVTTANPIYNARVNVVQNALESSNVDSTDEMIKLMQVKRQFETNQKFVKMQDETVQKAATELGRV
ncbi:MAG: flagellar hook-basal body complex protein [Clostridium butyricum]|nr:flagellar hook-basal body complex protein [Clostridium butyricum]